MNPEEAQKVLDKIIGQITGFENPYSLETFMQKFAFDIRLPMIAYDSFTGEQTWAQSLNPTKFVTMQNSLERVDDWQQPKKELKTIEDILAAWNETNHTTTERQIESENIAESDNIYNSEFIYRSQDIHTSKYALFSDSSQNLEYAAAIQRSNGATFSVRVEDSKDVSASFSVSWSGKISNSFFINDCYDMYECMFCSHMRGKKFCIANMQFEEAEYMELKQKVIEWMLSQ